MELSEPSSWAETIKEYEKSRRAPLVLSDVNKRLNRGEVSPLSNFEANYLST